ncbi:MAG: orotidine-5'-phosphate decarboxylase [Candidatus Nanopelagicaceae bacterium]|nr:orotidine-5'-phosphate decarboxylase [Candidatus Nanopelagicaceae bacterium]
MSNSPIILALDSPEVDSALSMISKTKEFISVYKLGLEFFLSQGLSGVSKIQNAHPEVRIFLDLKLHDIPNTVKGACKSIGSLNPYFLTVHASGGQEMIRAAADVLPNTLITAVTVLTSLDAAQLKVMGLPDDPTTLAVSLAKNAVGNGARAIVCSPLEVAEIKAALGERAVLITPGVRMASSESDDQKRVMTPAQAIAAGSDYLVIGRPITGAADPNRAAADIFASIN